MNTDASILAYKFRPKRTGFNIYAEYTQPQLTFLALVPFTLLYSFPLMDSSQQGILQYASSNWDNCDVISSDPYFYSGNV